MKRLTLSENNKKIVGVCGGIGEYFGIDATIVRILWIIVRFRNSGLCNLLGAYPLRPRIKGYGERRLKRGSSKTFAHKNPLRASFISILNFE